MSSAVAPIRVGLNLSFLTPGEMGGLEVYSRELTAALARRPELRLTLILNRLAAEEPGWRELGEVKLTGTDPRRRVEWVAADQHHVVRLARKAELDLVHSLASTGPLRGPFRRVVTVHDLNYLRSPDAHFGVRGLGMRVLVPLTVRRSHRVIAPSNATRDDLVCHLGVDQSMVDVVPEGIGQAPLGAGRAGVARARLGLEDRRLLLTVSAKRPHKNLPRLIGALARIPAERRPVLVLPGYPTPHEAELRELAERLGLAHDVRFLGWVSREELDDLYAAADCFAFPSLQEGFGLPVLEAMSRGVPVATSNRTSLAEVAGDAALLFDPEDEASIAVAIERLLADEGLRERLREAGRERAAGFTWDATAEGVVKSYRRALAAE